MTSDVSDDFKFGMHVVKQLFYFMKPVGYTYSTNLLIFRRLKRVGSVLSRSELDPFLYIWYHTVRTQSGLSTCDVCVNNYVIVILCRPPNVRRMGR